MTKRVIVSTETYFAGTPLRMQMLSFLWVRFQFSAAIVFRDPYWELVCWLRRTVSKVDTNLCNRITNFHGPPNIKVPEGKQVTCECSSSSRTLLSQRESDSVGLLYSFHVAEEGGCELAPCSALHCDGCTQSRERLCRLTPSVGPRALKGTRLVMCPSSGYSDHACSGLRTYFQNSNTVL